MWEAEKPFFLRLIKRAIIIVINLVDKKVTPLPIICTVSMNLVGKDIIVHILNAKKSEWSLPIRNIMYCAHYKGAIGAKKTLLSPISQFFRHLALFFRYFIFCEMTTFRQTFPKKLQNENRISKISFRSDIEIEIHTAIRAVCPNFGHPAVGILQK